MNFYLKTPKPYFKELIVSKSNTPKLDTEEEKIKETASESIDQVDAVYKQVKEKANDLYTEGKRTVCEAHDYLNEYADDLVKHVKEKPLTSLLIAGGIGFILSSLLKK